MKSRALSFGEGESSWSGARPSSAARIEGVQRPDGGLEHQPLLIRAQLKVERVAMQWLYAMTSVTPRPSLKLE